jgi:hypothetical protein
MRSPPAGAVCERVIARAVGDVSKPLVETRRIFARPAAAGKGPFWSSAPKRAVSLLQPHANLIGGEHEIFRSVDDPDDVACR